MELKRALASVSGVSQASKLRRLLGGRRARPSGSAGSADSDAVVPDKPTYPTNLSRQCSAATTATTTSCWSGSVNGAAVLLPANSHSEGDALRALASRPGALGAGAQPCRRSRLASCTEGSLASSAATSRKTSCSSELCVGDSPASATERAASHIAAAAAAATARAELACMLAPHLPPARRSGLATARMDRVVELVAQVADAADSRALCELLSVAAKAARCSPDLRQATLPAAVALLCAAAARTKPGYAARLAPEYRLGRRAALTVHGVAEAAWRWAPTRSDAAELAALKEEGRRYMRSIWSFQFSDLPGWSSPSQQQWR